MEEKQNELPPRPSPTLNYSTGRYEKKPYSLVGEMLLGFGVWVGGEILVAGLLLSMVNAGGYEYWAWILPSIAVLIVIWMSILSYTRWHMRGFLPHSAGPWADVPAADRDCVCVLREWVLKNRPVLGRGD